MKKKLLILSVFATIAFLIVGCATPPDVQKCIPEGEHIYGFWGGTWHGMIMVFSFIGELLFNDKIRVYASNNNGAWYDFGFIGGFFLVWKFIFGFLKAILTR